MTFNSYKESGLRHGLIVASVVLVAAIVVWLVLLVQLKGMGNDYREVVRATELQDVGSGVVTDMRRVLRDTQNDRDTLDGHFVKKSNAIAFLERLELLADHSGTSMNIENFDEVEERLRISLKANGTFSDLYYFLSLLESLPYKIAVNRLSLSEVNRGSGQWGAIVNLDLLSYLKDE